VSLISAGAGIARASLYDLSADWSDSANPNGVWSYYVGGALGVSGVRGHDTFVGSPRIWYDGWTDYFG